MGGTVSRPTVDHIERPNPPWRTERTTECGLDDTHKMVSRAEFYERVKDQGQQRAAMSVCMTCWHTAIRYGGWGRDHASTKAQFLNLWGHDPADVIGRDLHGKRRDLLNRELHVVGLLIEAHRDEFDQAMAGAADALTLDELRAKRSWAQAQAKGRR